MQEPHGTPDQSTIIVAHRLITIINAQWRGVWGLRRLTKAEDAKTKQKFTGHRRSNQIVPRMRLTPEFQSLKKTKIKLGGKISELISTKLHKVKVRQEPRESPVEDMNSNIYGRERHIGHCAEQRDSENEDEEVKIPDVNVQIVPTPVKKTEIPRLNWPSALPSPLKVIRRRRKRPLRFLKLLQKDFQDQCSRGSKPGMKEERDFPSEWCDEDWALFFTGFQYSNHFK